MGLNKLWIFGCSFSEGAGCLPQDTYYQFLLPEERGHRWIDLLSIDLNLELKNRSIGGSSNDGIFKKIIDNLKYIGPDDLVIIGLTDGDRFGIYDEPLISGSTLPEFRQINIGYIERSDDLTEVQRETLLNYLVNIRLPYRGVWERHYLSMGKELCSFIQKTLGTKTILWDTRLWSMFESIHTATNYKVNDGHWSYKGHGQAYVFMREQAQRVNFGEPINEETLLKLSKKNGYDYNIKK
jgi:hypothetical protein